MAEQGSQCLRVMYLHSRRPKARRQCLLTTATMTARPEPKLAHTLKLNGSKASKQPPLEASALTQPVPEHLPEPRAVKTHESASLLGEQFEPTPSKARLVFVGTATCVLEWKGVRIMTDPNFLHAGDHVHLGPGVTGTRVTDPAFPIEDLPAIDVVVLSHFHADHFDQLVQEKLRKDLPIVTTSHAQEHLSEAQLGFSAVYGMEVWESTLMTIEDAEMDQGRLPVIRVTATPGKHIAGVIGAINDALLHAIPPCNGHMLELGWQKPGEADVKVGYRIYISGDTLLVDELKEIPKRYPDVDLLLIHLGGTSIPSAAAPLLMVTMDGKQGVELMRLISPKLTIPVHFDDYDVFANPRSDFEQRVTDAGWDDRVLYLDRGDAFDFGVRL